MASSQGANLIYRNAVLADNPIAYYQFDETSGTNAADSSGNSANGTYTGTVGLNATSGAPNLGTAIDLNPSVATGYVALPNLGTYAQNSVEAWIQLDTVNSACCGAILAVNGWDTGRLHLNVVNSNLQHAVNGDVVGFVNTTGGILASTWYHVVVTNDVVADQTKFYLNGVEVSDDGDNTLQNVVFGVTGMQIGAWDNTRHLDGRIDEVAIYGTALSSSDVAAHYAAATAIPEPSGAALLLLGGTIALARRRR